MTDFATPEDIANRTNAAKEAAVAAGRELGLEITEGKVLYELFSVVVHLAPAPVVARIPTVLPHTTTFELARRQQQELDVAQWLHDQGTPVIPPSSLVPRKPVQRDGFSITFWPFTEEDKSSEPDYVKNSELTADLHKALRDYPGELSFLSSAEPRFVREALDRLENQPDVVDPADLHRAKQEWQVLEPLVSDEAEFQKAFPGIELQPIHGDSPPANIFASTNGPLFSDFELITKGPVEWDLGGLGLELEAAYDRGAEKNDLRPLDKNVLRFVNAVGAIRVIAYLSVANQLPAMVDFMQPFINQWRDTDFYA